jgi:transposase-like protein
MDPPQQWCHNWDCPARGQAGQGNLHLPSQKEQRYRCKTGGRTFAATPGTPCYR